MPRKSPYQIDLSVEEATELNRRATKYTLPYFEVMRAKMILMAAAGVGNDEIAGRMDTRREVVSQRFVVSRRGFGAASDPREPL